MKRFLLAVVTLILPPQPCMAGLDSPIVWLTEDISLKGYTRVALHPVSNDTGETFEFDVAKLMTDTMKDELAEAGLEIVDPKEAADTRNVVILKNSLVFYKPGSVGGRWIGFGGGAAICILRTYLFELESNDLIGEVIVAKQVAGGGLFSAGAEKSVPKQAAKNVIQELVALASVGDRE